MKWKAVATKKHAIMECTSDIFVQYSSLHFVCKVEIFGDVPRSLETRIEACPVEIWRHCNVMINKSSEYKIIYGR